MDLKFETYCPVCLITPLSVKGHSWLLRNVSVEADQWIGGAMLVELWLAQGIFDGARGDGLEVDLREVLEIK